jgi:hypothetical protein
MCNVHNVAKKAYKSVFVLTEQLQCLASFTKTLANTKNALLLSYERYCIANERFYASLSDNLAKMAQSILQEQWGNKGLELEN